MAHPGGRPPKLTPEQRQEVYDALVVYIRVTDDPTLAGFLSGDDIALQHSVTKDNLYDWQEFSELRSRAILKQESHLLDKGGSGKYNSSLAIFRLKQPQHGYRDRVDSDITSGGEKIGVGLSAEQAEQLIRSRANRSDI
jgi:hypothetical protein